MVKHTIKIRKVSQEKLSKIAHQRGAIRAGSSKHPKARAEKYKDEGYGGTMFVAPTNDMKKAENKLLRNSLRHNTHERSNAPNKPGKVYVIKGKKSDK